MSASLRCKWHNPVTDVVTFVYTDNREIEFTCTHQELEDWFKSAKTLDQMMDAPFPTGPGIFDHPVCSLALFSLLAMIGGNEELVGAEFSVKANKKTT